MALLQVQELGATTRQLQEALQAASLKPKWSTGDPSLPREPSDLTQQRPQTAPARGDSSVADSFAGANQSLGLGGERTRKEAVSNLATELKVWVSTA